MQKFLFITQKCFNSEEEFNESDWEMLDQKQAEKDPSPPKLPKVIFSHNLLSDTGVSSNTLLFLSYFYGIHEKGTHSYLCT